MSPESTSQQSDNRPVDKMRDIVVEWIETVADQGEKALQAMGFTNPPRSLPVAVNVLESPTEIVVTIDLPGVEPQGVDVVLVGNMLTVKGERPSPVILSGQVLHRNECPTGRFERSLALPVAVDPSRVSAESRNGVLTVTLAREVRSGGTPIQVVVRSAEGT